jgi:hypothetical protein
VGEKVWLFLRKNIGEQIKYVLSNALKEIPFAELIKASTMRWPIERALKKERTR